MHWTGELVSPSWRQRVRRIAATAQFRPSGKESFRVSLEAMEAREGAKPVGRAVVFDRAGGLIGRDAHATDGIDGIRARFKWDRQGHDTSTRGY